MKKTTPSTDAPPPADDTTPPAGDPTPPADDPSTTADDTPPVAEEPVEMPHAGGCYVRNADGSLTKQED